MKRPVPLLLLPLLLAACTGTEEPTPTLRLALLLGGGAVLRTVTPAADTATPAVTDNQTVTVDGGVRLDTTPAGNRLLLTLAGGIETRNADLADRQAFVAPPNPPFTSVCFTASALSAARDRLLALSACANGPQQLALYRSDGTLVWTALLPTFLPPAPGTDTPPIRLAVRGDVGIVARPRLGGGSEVLRAAVNATGDPVAIVSDPLPTAAVRDLAPYGPDLLAATDTGIRKLGVTGAPDPTATLSAFGTARYDRLWTGVSGTRSLLAAWRSNVLAGTGSEPLLLWDGVKASAATVDVVADLRDVSIALDGNLYALTGVALNRYDTVYGLQQGNWRTRTLLSGLTDPRAVTALVP